MGIQYNYIHAELLLGNRKLYIAVLRIILFTVEASVGGENYIVEDPYPVGID